MDAAMTIYPMTMRDVAGRFLVIDRRQKEPFYVKKDQPETSDVVRTVREALDLNKSLTLTTATADRLRIVGAELVRPEERAKVVCPDRPEMTRQFWAEQEVVPALPPDVVRWVSKVPGCASYRVAFFRSAAFYWIHEQHPRSNELLATAWRSINENLELEGSLAAKARAFIVDLRVKPH